jgi:transposase
MTFENALSLLFPKALSLVIESTQGEQDKLHITLKSTLARQLWLELQQQGYSGSYAPLRRWVYMQKHFATQAVAPAATQLTTKQLTYLLLRDQASLETAEQTTLETLLKSLPDLKQLHELAAMFKQALLHKKPELMDTWRTQVKTSAFMFFQTFVNGLASEWDALKAACSLSWSNGPTEGVVNRIKPVKRQMYSRGSFSLLRKRVLLTT